MPRPKAGLLKRMFRLAKVEQMHTGGSKGPVLMMRHNAEYHIGLQLVKSPLSMKSADLQRVQWLSLASQGGIAPCVEVRQS